MEGGELQIVSRYIIRNEGVRTRAYLDTRGVRIIGVGFDLERPGAREALARLGYDYNRVFAREQSLTVDHIGLLVQREIRTAVNQAQSLFPNFNRLDAVRRAILVDLTFDMGLTRLARLERFRAAIGANDWERAANELANSDYSSFTGQRAIRNVTAIRTGVAPALMTAERTTPAEDGTKAGKDRADKWKEGKDRPDKGKEGKETNEGKDGKDAKEGKDGTDKGQEGKDIKEGKDGKDTKEGKDGSDKSKEGKDIKEGKDGKDSKEGKESKEGKDRKDSKEGKDRKDSKEGKDGKDSKEGKDRKDSKEGKDGKDSKEGKDRKDSKEGKDGKEHKEGKDGKDGKEGKEGRDHAYKGKDRIDFGWLIPSWPRPV
jgi:GH24 family phage-related lysozyme (muramidase)